MTVGAKYKLKTACSFVLNQARFFLYLTLDFTRIEHTHREAPYNKYLYK